jgi:hypothetical protein
MSSNEKLTRMETLLRRQERLIEANLRHDYTTMVLLDGRLVINPRNKQYNRVLLEIHRERVGIWNFKRKNK